MRLHALHWGDPGQPLLVLLHGGGANAHWWDHLAPAFADRFHVVALDFRGHGDSDHPDELVVGAFNEDLEALVEHLDPDRLFLAGASMGGGVALDHAARHPDVRGLVLIDVARGGERRSRRATRLALTLRRTYATREEAVERYRFMPPAEHAPEQLRATIAEHSVRLEPDGRFGFKFDPRWFGLTSRPRPDPSAVRCPALVVRGGQSALLSREGAEAFADELADARVVEIENAGHHVQIDQPEAVSRAMARFLDGIVEGSAAHEGALR